MAQRPDIYTIQASDAPQHTGKLREILQRLKEENRIGEVSVIRPGDDFSALPGMLKEEDMVMIVLTNQLESQKKQIEQQCKEIKENRPGVRIAEILVDNVVYDNAFITFPDDLRYIRGLGDMDAAWGSIELSLKEMFPVAGEASFSWKPYVKYAALILLILFLGWAIYKIIPGPQAYFTYYVGDAGQDTVTACYSPCDVHFINESQNYDFTQWEIQDTVFTDRHLRLEFNQPGDFDIVLTAFNNRRKHTHRKNLMIKPLPYADFEVRNNGCTAPCRVVFSNTSSNAATYSWDFGNGQTSGEEHPEIMYETANEYDVTLLATNDEGRTSQTRQTVTTIQDDAPFADFTFSGNRGTLPRQVNFTNRSQNADSYVWQFPGASPSASSSQNPTVTYANYDTYSVTLIARKNDGRSHSQVKVVPVSNIPVFEIDREILRQIQLGQISIETGDVQSGGLRQGELNNRNVEEILRRRVQ